MRKVFILVDGTRCTLLSKTNIGNLHRLSTAAGYEGFYSQGIGAISRTRWTDTLFAPNLEPKAIEIFQTLLDLDLKYDDRIYIFGYSRGAVIARTLAMCIASTESLKAAGRHSGIYGSISAEIEFLCLFDPVLGWPRLYKSFVKNHEAVLELRIKNYLEILACDERRFLFPSDSYSASKAVKKKLALSTSARGADSTNDRKISLRDLQLRKTRKCVWFPGSHSDVGGDSGDLSLGAHALATALEELIASAEREEMHLQFPARHLQDLVLSRLCVDGSVQVGKTTLIKKIVRKVTAPILRRAPEKRSLVVHHLAHPTCKLSEHTASLTEHLAEYPDYRRLK